MYTYFYLSKLGNNFCSKNGYYVSMYVKIGLKAAEVASTWQHHFVWLVRQQASAQYSIILVWLKLFAENKKKWNSAHSWTFVMSSLCSSSNIGRVEVWKYVWHFLIWQISFAHANVVVHKIELKVLFLSRSIPLKPKHVCRS